MSTVQPATEVAIAEKVRAKGAAFVECPVGGTTGPARQGQLVGLLGAEAADAERAHPLLKQLAAASTIAARSARRRRSSSRSTCR